MVSDNPLPGDVYSPTQPFPVKPPAIARNTFSPSEVAKVTPEHEKYCRGLLELDGGVMTGGPYAQYGPRPRVIFPGWTGGGNWNGGAFIPDLGYLVLPTQDHGMLNKMVKSTEHPEHVRPPPARRRAAEHGHELLGRRQGLAVSAATLGRAGRGEREHGRHRVAGAAWIRTRSWTSSACRRPAR